MPHVCRNQVVDFYQQNVLKHLWKSGILIKDAAASSLKMSLFHRCFSNIFVSKNQLPGLSVSDTLVEMG